MPPSLQSAAERKLGEGMGSVRVHADAESRDYAASLRAQAVTVGQHIYLSDVDPSSAAARDTILHELVHVAQSPTEALELPRAVTRRSSGAELEARRIAEEGFVGTQSKPVESATPGVAHLKGLDEDEELDQTAATPEPAPPTVTAEELLNPPADEEDHAAKPGSSGAGESVAYEITVMQPLRAIQDALDRQEWEDALRLLQSIGMRLLEYQNLYEKSDPLLYETIQSARGWLSQVYQQLNRRLDRDLWSDDRIANFYRGEVLVEFQRIEGLLH